MLPYRQYVPTDGQFALITVLDFNVVRTVVPSSVKVADNWVVVLVAPPVSFGVMASCLLGVAARSEYRSETEVRKEVR